MAGVGRPKRHEVLIQTLRAEAGFPTMRDALLLAAAIGFSRDRRAALGESGERIDYETLTAPNYADTFVGMLAAVNSPNDAEVLDSERLPERILIFEEYASGGLDVIQEEINGRQQTVAQVVASLVSDALASSATATQVSVEDLLGAID
jgi:dnd system-associated protein 4